MTRKKRDTAADAETAGIQYATDQLESEYFINWVGDQIYEASQMPPEKVHPLETKSDAKSIARKMLQQLEWDTKRDFGNMRSSGELERLVGSDEPEASTAFFEGLHRGLSNPSTVDWLADEILEMNRGARGGGVKEFTKSQHHYINGWNQLEDGIRVWVSGDEPTRLNMRGNTMGREFAERVVRSWWGSQALHFAWTDKVNADITRDYTHPSNMRPRGPRESNVVRDYLAADAETGRTRLDQILDQVERGKREVTIDAEGYTPEQIDKIVAAAKARGFHVSGTRRWLLIRNLGSVTEAHAVHDYIAVDRNDRRVAGPFRSRHEAEDRVPPGGYVKFSSATRRQAPPAPSSYPMFRQSEEKRYSGRSQRHRPAASTERYDVYLKDEYNKWVLRGAVDLIPHSNKEDVERALKFVDVFAPRGADKMKWYRDGRLLISDADGHEMIRAERS